MTTREAPVVVALLVALAKDEAHRDSSDELTPELFCFTLFLW